MKWEKKKNKKESQLLLIICLLYLMIWDARLHSLNIHDIELTCIRVVFVQFFPVQHLEIVRQRQSIEKSNEKLKKKIIQTLNKFVWIGIGVIMIFQYAQWLFKVIFTKNQRCMAKYRIEFMHHFVIVVAVAADVVILSVFWDLFGSRMRSHCSMELDSSKPKSDADYIAHIGLLLVCFVFIQWELYSSTLAGYYCQWNI